MKAVAGTLAVLVLLLSLVGCGSDVPTELTAEEVAKIPPFPAWNVVAALDAENVTITWAGDGEELVEYQIYRKTNNQADFSQIGALPIGGKASGQFSYVDKTAVPGETYTYGVRALKRFYLTESDLSKSQSLDIPQH